MPTRGELPKGGAALPLAAVLASPGLARAAAESTQGVHPTLADGTRVGGALALPDGEGRAGILLIHEKHGFANPTTARYDEADAELAWKRTIAFLDAVMSGSASAGSGIASAA